VKGRKSDSFRCWDLLDEVATERVPAVNPKASCSRRAAYMPAFTIGMAQQQYSRAFMVVGR